MFLQAHPDRGMVPRIVEKTLADAEAFETGSLLLMDANGKFAECGVDPAAIAAVSVAPAGTDTTGFNRFAHKEFPPGKMQGIALSGVPFIADITGALPDADGGDYGVTDDATLGWTVDFGKIGGPCRLTNRDPIGNSVNIASAKTVVEVVFLAGFIQPI